jgi:hypothetical protein
MGLIKGNTTIVEVADTLLVSQRSLSWKISTEFLDIAGYSGKAKNRKPNGKYSIDVSLSGLYDVDNPGASSDLLLEKIQNRERVKVYIGSNVMNYWLFLGYVQNLKKEFNKGDFVTYSASIISDSTLFDVIIDWILKEGVWDDTGVWKDYEYWKDN